MSCSDRSFIVLLRTVHNDFRDSMGIFVYFRCAEGDKKYSNDDVNETPWNINRMNETLVNGFGIQCFQKLDIQKQEQETFH